MINRKLLAAILAVIALTVFGTFIAMADNDATSDKACAESCAKACAEACKGTTCDPEACKTACAEHSDGKTCDAEKAAACAEKCAEKHAEKCGTAKAKQGCTPGGCSKKATPQKTS